MERPLSLVIVSRALAPYRVNFYNEVALALQPHGWRVVLVVAKASAEDHPWTYPSGRHEALQIIDAATVFPMSPYRQWMAKYIQPYITLPNSTLLRCLENYRPDVVWTHEYSPFCLTAALWASWRDKISILSSDLGDKPPAYAICQQKLRLQRMLSFLYQAVIPQTMEATRRRHPAGAPQCFAPHAINTEEYLPAQTPPAGTFRFLFTGALSKRKGLDSLLAAARILSRSGAVFELRVVGTGPLAQWLGEQTEPWLSIAGFREGADFIQEYQSAQAYVLPTRGDTYAVTIHEAAASGLPLIIGREAGAAETLVEEGVSGFCIDPEDVTRLAARMKDLLSDRPRARAMGMRARELAVKLDVKLLGKKTADFILRFAPDEVR
jgi:glycosyltransferase involved in cell wall biosynthesis